MLQWELVITALYLETVSAIESTSIPRGSPALKVTCVMGDGMG
jgi:hypothetical protein